MSNLLIHSMNEFRDLILATLDIAAVADVVEIGTEYGGMSTVLSTWLKSRNGRLRCIDPSPKPAFLEWVATEPDVQHLAVPSLEALPYLSAADAWLIDGDHNWYTVFHELEGIFAKTWAAGKHPLIFLHDVCWPCARRDMYYAPYSIPEEFRKPFTFNAGAVLDNAVTVPGRGFRGGNDFAYADTEGGPRNGVLTAVENSLTSQIAAGHKLAWCRVPAVFGLGIIFDTASPWSQEVMAHLLPWHENKLIATLEQNRLANYLTVVDMQGSTSACSVPALDGAYFSEVEQEALWGRFYTGAP